MLTCLCVNIDERDVFDKLFEEAPEKLEPVKRVRVSDQAASDRIG